MFDCLPEPHSKLDKPATKRIRLDNGNYVKTAYKVIPFYGYNLGPGYPLSCYMPKTFLALKDTFIVSSLASVDHWSERPHQVILELLRSDVWFDRRSGTAWLDDFGDPTWS